MAISEWVEEDAEAWDSDKTGRPKELKNVWHAVVAMMAGLWNNCPVAYAMLKTGVHVEVPKEGFGERSPLQTRFRDAIQEYESLSGEIAWWDEIRVCLTLWRPLNSYLSRRFTVNLQMDVMVSRVLRWPRMLYGIRCNSNRVFTQTEEY